MPTYPKVLPGLGTACGIPKPQATRLDVDCRMVMVGNRFHFGLDIQSFFLIRFISSLVHSDG
jgi:hypothetical protein